MKHNEETAYKAFADLQPAERDECHDSMSDEDADAAHHRRIVLHHEIDHLEVAGPDSAFAKIYVGLTDAMIACPEEESGINFASMRAALLEHLRPAALAVPNG